MTHYDVSYTTRGGSKGRRLTYAQHEAVAYLAQKIKETREAING